MRQDDRAKRLLVRLFPDYGAEWPVWGLRGAGRQGLLSPAHFPGLPADLVEDLRSWQRRWEDENPEPWIDRRPPQAAARQAELDRLAQRLAAEVSGTADVQTDTWSSTG